jgi:hypothetical protein
MAISLFIFAATVSLFIAEHRIGSPYDQLKRVLKFETISQVSQLDKSYLPVLHQMISGLEKRAKTTDLDRFQNIVGSIVVLDPPLCTRSLAVMCTSVPGYQSTVR